MLVNQPGTFTILLGGKGAASVEYAGTLEFNAGNGTLDISAGRTLAVTNAVTLDAGTIIDPGLVTLAGFSQTGGAVTTTGSFVSSAGVTIGGGTDAVSGGTFEVTAGGLQVSGASTDFLLNGGTAEITGGTTLLGGTLSVASTLASDTFTVSGGTLDVGTGSDLTASGAASFTGGLENITGGLFWDTGSGMDIGGTATVDVSGGELAIAGTSTLATGLSVSGSGVFYITTGGLGIGSGGVLTVSGGDATVAGATTLTAGTAMLSGGTFYVSTGGLTIAGNGTLTESGANTQISGGATLTSGTVSVSAGTFFVSDTGMSIGSGGSLAVTGGAATVEGGTALSGAATVNGGTLYVENGGLSFGSTGSLTVSAGQATVSGGTTLTAGAALVSGGTFAVSSGGLTIGAAGTLTASGGLTSVTGGLTSAGTLVLQNGGTLGIDSMSVTGGLFADSAADVVVSGLASFSGGSDTFSGGAFGAGTLTVGNTVTLAGGGLAIGSGGIVDSGTLTGYGVLQGAISGSGSVVASGGTLALNTGLTSGATGFTIASNATSVLRLNGSVASPVTIGFAGSQGALELADFTTASGHDSLNFSGTVSGMTVGASATAPTDAIDVQGATITSASLSGSTLTITDATGTIASINLTNTAGAPLAGAYANWQPDAALGGTDVFLSTAVCFAAGTRILTPEGEVPVETLAAGDRVMTLAGGEQEVRPVRWIGQRRLDLRTHPRPELVAPIRVRRGAIAPSVPCRDLVVSPDHCLLFDGRLVPAKLLINGMTIVQERDVPAVHYFHVELDRHAVLLAEGVAAESYLDTGNRGFFANTGAPVALHPELAASAAAKAWETDACAPLTLERALVEPIWRDLARRAMALGFHPAGCATTRDPAVRLVAEGRVLIPVPADAGRFVFVVPAGVRSVRLVSRADIPADLRPCLDDFRRLGVRVARIVAHGDGWRCDMPPDHPGLRRGWHPPEQDGTALWRWTDGDAEVPLAGEGPVVVEVWASDVATYRLPAEDGAVARSGQARSPEAQDRAA